MAFFLLKLFSEEKYKMNLFVQKKAALGGAKTQQKSSMHD
jgi:hypothetical protein